MNKRSNRPKWIFQVKRNGKPYRYMVRFYVEGVKIYLGCFKTIKQAQQAIKSWQKEAK